MPSAWIAAARAARYCADPRQLRLARDAKAAVNRLHGTVTPLAAPGERYGGHLKEVALKMLKRAQRIDEAAGVHRSIHQTRRTSAFAKKVCALKKPLHSYEKQTPSRPATSHIASQGLLRSARGCPVLSPGMT